MYNFAPGIRVTLQSSCSGPKLRDIVEEEEEEEINKCMNIMVLCGHYLKSRYCSVLDLGHVWCPFQSGVERRRRRKKRKMHTKL